MIDRVVVSFLNPSGTWQTVYDGSDMGVAQGTGAEYESYGNAVDAWVHDDATGWALQHWAQAATGVTAKTTSTATPKVGWDWRPFAVIGAIGAAFATIVVVVDKASKKSTR